MWRRPVTGRGRAEGVTRDSENAPYRAARGGQAFLRKVCAFARERITAVMFRMRSGCKDIRC